MAHVHVKWLRPAQRTTSRWWEVEHALTTAGLKTPPEWQKHGEHSELPASGLPVELITVTQRSLGSEMTIPGPALALRLSGHYRAAVWCSDNDQLFRSASLPKTHCSSWCSSPTLLRGDFPICAQRAALPLATMPRVPIVFLLLAIVGIATNGIAADMVVLKNGQRIAGTLDPSADVGPDQVAIKTSNGVLRLPRDAIASEDLGFDARKTRLKADDLAGHLALAAWCRAQGMNNEALALLERAIKMKDVSLAARALHARLVDEDEKRGPQQALELYRRYKKDGGDDPATLQRLAQLEKVIADFEAQSNTVSIAPAVPKAVPTIQGGLESKGWDNEAPQWSNPVRPQIITVPTDAGVAPALKIEFKGGTQEKATIKRTAHLTIGNDSVLTFFAQTPGDKPLSIAIGVKTGSKYLFHESPQQQVKPGQDFQKLRFDFKAANFKSAASSWNYDTRVADLNDVKEIQLLIYNGSADGALIISNMGFPAKPDL